MAKAASKSSTNTDLFVGSLRASIGLFGTVADPRKLTAFDTAGPNGGRLMVEQRAVAAPIPADVEQQPDAPVRSDPLSDAEPVAATATVEVPHVEIPNGFGEERSGVATYVGGEYRQVLVEDGSGEVVEPEQVRRGVRLEDDRFVDCTEQIAAIEERTKLDRIEVVATIDSTRVRRQRVLGAKYIGAQDTPKDATDPETYSPAAPALRLLWEALRKRREVAVVKYTLRSRQQLGVIEADAREGVLVLLSVVWAEQWRDAPAKAKAIAKAQVSEAHVDAMVAILGELHDTPDALDELRDDAVALREELHVRAVSGEMDAAVVEALPEPVEAPDLGDVLAASVAAVKARRGGKV